MYNKYICQIYFAPAGSPEKRAPAPNIYRQNISLPMFHIHIVEPLISYELGAGKVS